MSKSCLIDTPEIKELASKFPILNIDRVKYFISKWQEHNKKDIDSYPTEQEFKEFLDNNSEYKYTSNSPITKIISGGQTGVDTIGLQVAKELGIETGGTAPKGFIRERGIDNEDIASYGLIEITDDEQTDYTKRKGKTDPYTGRTELNVRNSDGTVYFYTSDDKSGKIATERAATEFNKPFLVNPTTEELKTWIRANNIKVLNVAGNRGSKLSKDNNVAEILKEALSETFDSSIEKQSEEPINKEEESKGDPFAVPKVTSLETQYQVDLLFDPQIRRYRVSLIARLFSNEIDSILKEEGKDTNNRDERINVIKKLTPGGIFKRVANIFESYVNLTDEERIRQEFDTINRKKGADKYTDEQKRAAAEKKATYKLQEYKKLVDDMEVFKALAEEASMFLIFTEGIRVDPNYLSPDKADFSEDSSEDNNKSNDNDDIMSREESAKEGWMTGFRNVSSHESLSQIVRAAIRNVPKLDYRGKYDVDDLGFNIYLDADYVHAVLIDKLRHMTSVDDMLPLLQELTKTKLWVKQVIKLLQKNDELFSQFYQDFRKDFVSYWIQKKIMKSDGSFIIQTIAINTPEGIQYLLDSWRDNYENGTQLDEDSVYNKDGSINKEHAAKGLNLVNNLINQFTNISTQDRLELLEKEEIFDQIMKMLHMIGIDANPAILNIALHDIKSIPGVNITDPIMILLPQLNTIFDGINKGEVVDKVEESGQVKRGDLLNTFGSVYSQIAYMMADVTADAIESSVRENDKSYYSHVNPSYLGKLIKNLKNASNNIEKFEKFIQEEFKQYEWFFKNGIWRNDWIEQIVNNPIIRNGLEHKVLLNHSKVEYPDWDSIDYTIVLLNEYWGHPNKAGNSVKWAWFHVPILSDSPSAEFIKFRKYTSNDILDDEGNYRTYDDIILDKLVNIVNQEYDRIMLVRERDDKFQHNNSRVSPIANFDIIRNEDGSIKSLGGAEFKFLPDLNAIVYKNGETFIDRIGRYKREKSGEELRDLIREELAKIMDSGFEAAYQKWYDIGLFEELSNDNDKYKYLPFKGTSQHNATLGKTLSRAKEILENAWTKNMDELRINILNNRPYNTKEANATIQEIKDSLAESIANNSLTMQEYNAITRSLFLKDNAKEALREYYWNSKLATSQIIQLTISDLAFFKNLTDFQKRFKAIHSPAIRLNTKAKYNGELVGREWERTIYLQDSKIKSQVLDDIEEVIMQKHNKGEIDDYGAAFVLAQYGYSNHTVTDSKGKETKYAKIGKVMVKTSKINVADAQAYRSLSSYRAIMIMSGQWTDDMEKAYNNFKNGNWNMEDFNIIWQTKKPFVYTQINNDSGIDGHTGIKTPTSHKNSEFLLLALHSTIAGATSKSAKLRAINKFMEDNQIDVVQFESAVKFGNQGIIPLDDINSESDVINRLNEYTGIGKHNENPNVVHKISYEDYGIQTPTPEHLIEDELRAPLQLVGTQIRKLITADMPNDIIIEINGRKLTKKEWLDLYNRINTENILQSFLEISEIFKDPKEVERVLLEEIRGNPRYGVEMQRACTLDKDGNFNIPLFDPVQSLKIQELLNSIIKNRVTKQKIRGGSLIQVTSYGLTEDLHIVFEGEGENRRIKYFECYMPLYSKKLIEPLLDPITHQLDINKLPNDLRKLIGYRVPTESHYSMVPLYIKGFLPQQSGSAIMLPAEITTIAGSDYDVDKLYVMLPEFDIIKYDKRRAREDYARINSIFNGILSQFTNSQLAEDILDSDTDDFNQWFNENKNKYKLNRPIIRKVKYDHNKQVKDNPLRARNNLLIDLMYGVLTNASMASRLLTPGSFNYQERAARISSLLKSVSEDELIDILIKANIAPKNLRNYLDSTNQGRTFSAQFLDQLNRDGVKYKKIQKSIKGKTETSYQVSNISAYLFDVNVDTLNKLLEDNVKEMDPLSPTTQVELHQQNMTGANMIGIYANHNANHALMQHTELALSEQNGSFILNGKSLTSLHNIKNEDGEYISSNNAGFLNASVDNVKARVLEPLNQNSFTADATMLLSRLGYNPIEIGLLMNQPIILDMTKAYFRESKNGKDKESVIETVLRDYKYKAGITADLTYRKDTSDKFFIENLADNIIIAKDATSDRSSTADFRKLSFYKNQVAVGYLFMRIMSSADALSQLTQATRADTQNGAAGPTIADTLTKMQKLQDFIKNYYTSLKFPLVNADVLSDTLLDDINDEDEIREKLINSPLPFLQAFYSLGIRKTVDMLKPYFPQYTKSFIDVIDTLRLMTRAEKLNVKTMNNIYNDLLAYIMSKTEFFGTRNALNIDSDTEHSIVTSRESRSKFINTFPEEFKKIVSENEDIASFEFIQRLKVIRANKNNPVPTLVFKNVGSLTSTLKERYMRDWTSLLYSSNPKAVELAFNLFRYSYYRNGFAFGPNTFIHLAPVALRKAIPDYLETLRELLTSNDDYSPFIYQYIYNHLDNRKLVPEVPDSATFKFTNEDGKALDQVILSLNAISESDKTIVRKSHRIEGSIEYDFFEFICKQIKGEMVYYRIDFKETTSDGSVITYNRIQPLGSLHNFIEYEYGKDVDSMSSVISKNSERKTGALTLTSAERGEVIDDSSVPKLPEDYMDSFAQIREDAFMQEYGVRPDTENAPVSEEKQYEFNTDFVDEDNLKLCSAEELIGVPPLKSF